MIIDSNDVTDRFDELAATAAIVLSPLPIDLVCSWGETIQVEFPEGFRLHIDNKQVLKTPRDSAYVAGKNLVELLEFHIPLHYCSGRHNALGYYS
ncbi:MAG: hypothetical protein GF334_12575 [Candidatus Altiarchaeales archaeon]|nr:hypothetical protein [Candidatus Altiarchaeales archaeon]